MNTKFFLLGFCISAALSSCGLIMSDTVVQGEVQTVNGAAVRTWAKISSNGQVTQTGITLPMATIQNGPVSGAPVVAQIDFPAAVQQTTFLQHVGLDWNPHGHEPEGRYNTPHFDLHFHGISKAEATSIDCKDMTQINQADVPQGWAPPVPPGVPPQAVCVPTMGFHSVPLSEFSAPGQFKPGLFDKVMIAGSYWGKFIFLEPMVTQQLLLSKQNFSLPVPMPTNLGRTTRYPTTFNAVYDPALNAYQFILGDFQTVQ